MSQHVLLENGEVISILTLWSLPQVELDSPLEWLKCDAFNEASKWATTNPILLIALREEGDMMMEFSTSSKMIRKRKKRFRSLMDFQCPRMGRRKIRLLQKVGSFWSDGKMAYSHGFH